ncbi:Elastin microfibril interfacer [Mactra antiquata]
MSYISLTTCLILCLLVPHSFGASKDDVIETLLKDVQMLKDEMELMKREQKLSKRDAEKRFVLGPNPFAEKPAFSASLTNHATNLGNYQTIIFDNVFTNDLGGYNGLTGVFTAPSNGTYFFTSTVMSHSGQYLETNICLNGQTKVLMYSYDTSFEQGANSVVLVLQAGDSVWVRHNANEGSNAYGGHWSTFSGFMI